MSQYTPNKPREESQPLPSQPSYPYPSQPQGGAPPPNYPVPPPQQWQPPQKPPKKKRGPLFWVLVAIGILVVLFIGGSLASSGLSSPNTGTAVTPAPSSQVQDRQVTDTPTPAPAQHFKVGDVVKVGDVWNITIKSMRTTSGGEFDKPKAGNIYLVFSVSAKNISPQEQTFYGSSGFTLRDPDGQSLSTAIVLDTKDAPSGKVEAGAPIAGEIVYEVPKSVHHFTLSYEQNMFESGMVIWDITI